MVTDNLQLSNPCAAPPIPSLTKRKNADDSDTVVPAKKRRRQKRRGQRLEKRGCKRDGDVESEEDVAGEGEKEVVVDPLQGDREKTKKRKKGEVGQEDAANDGHSKGGEMMDVDVADSEGADGVKEVETTKGKAKGKRGKRRATSRKGGITGAEEGGKMVDEGESGAPEVGQPNPAKNTLTDTNDIEDDKEELEPPNVSGGRRQKPLALPPAPFGNYEGYYRRRNPTSSLDPRLRLLDPTWLNNARVLDIGCNTGEFTIQVALHTTALQVDGIDIDPSLIRKARSSLAVKASRIDFNDDGPPETREGRFGYEEETDFFPASCPASLGVMPILRNNAPGFPRNVSFRCGNFVTEALPIGMEKYDVIFALSVTKWVHVVWGDDGLRVFFAKCYAALKRGGRLVLEPQGSDAGYRKDRKMAIEMGVVKDGGKELVMKPEGFLKYLVEDIGFKTGEWLGGVEGAEGGKGFQRNVYVFMRS
ncbi:Bicoid-interacting protein 3-domain-containing protein [Chytridium lagenaria]|nr:Bicoid-interacting protein 3-domain-containing protein [Chytridium lagenaria]